MALWSTVDKSATSTTFRLDAEFYKPEYLQFEKATCNGDPMVNVVQQIMHPVEITRVYADDGIRILLAQNIRPNRLEMAYAVYMPQAVQPGLAKNRLKPGDVVMTRSGANFGDTASFFGESEDVYACADCLVIRPKDISSGYLSTFLNTRIGRGLLDRGSYGAAQPHIAPTYLRELRIPRFGKLETDVDAYVRGAHQKTKDAATIYAEAEALLESALGLDKLDLTPRLFYERPYANVQAAERFDAEYFQPPKMAVLNALAKMPGQAVRDQYRSARQLWQPDEGGAAEQVRNYDLTHALQPFLDETVEPATHDTIGSTKKKLKPGDLLVSRLRSYLKEIAVVLDTGPIPMVGSTEFIVLRPQKGAVRVEALLVYLRSKYVQTVLKWCQDGSNHPRFREGELLNLRIPDVVRDHQDEIVVKVQASIQARREARRLLDEAKAIVEKAILGDG